MDSQRFTCVDGDNLDTETACRLIVGCVAPRPVAWITSIDEQGRVNAAPFSSYNYVATSPPMVAINIAARATGGATKDTARNIVRSGELVINVATEYNMELMHRSVQEFAPDVSEIEELGIPLLQSRHVKPPRIAISPVQMECRLDQVIVLGRGVNTLYIAEVVAFHLSSEVYDGQRVDTARVRPLARLGGPADTLARGLAHQLQARLQQPVIVDSKAGGAATIGTGFVARAKPDGYTLLMGTSAGHAVTPLMQHIAYDGIADFAFIAVVANQPNVLVVNPDLGVDSLQGLIALAKKQPGKLNYASAGTGGATHLGAEAFLQRAQIRITHVPYGGAAPALKDLLGGQVQVGMLNLGATQAFIEQGKLKALAYGGTKRSALLPQVAVQRRDRLLQHDIGRHGRRIPGREHFDQNRCPAACHGIHPGTLPGRWPDQPAHRCRCPEVRDQFQAAPAHGLE